MVGRVQKARDVISQRTYTEQLDINTRPKRVAYTQVRNIMILWGTPWSWINMKSVSGRNSTNRNSGKRPPCKGLIPNQWLGNLKAIAVDSIHRNLRWIYQYSGAMKATNSNPLARLDSLYLSLFFVYQPWIFNLETNVGLINNMIVPTGILLREI